MPRKNTDKRPVITTVGGHCKIRKRGCYSSSSTTTTSSSLPKRNYRLKRAILVGKRTGSSTPVPSWKMALKSPVPAAAGSSKEIRSGGDLKGFKEASASARRLAATLWEINGLQGGEPEVAVFHGEREDKESKTLGKSGRMVAVEDGYAHLLDQSDSSSPALPAYHQKKDGSKATGHRRRLSTASQKLQLTESIKEGAEDSIANNNIGGFFVEQVASHGAHVETSSFNFKTRLKDVSNSLKTSKELLRVLLRILGQQEEQQDRGNSSRLTLVLALRVELDRARLQVEHLIRSKDKSKHKDLDSVLRQFAAEKAAWKSREQERIVEAVSSKVSRELEVERNLRKRAERMNKRLGRELAESRAMFSRAVRELDSERKEREVLEQTCEELAMAARARVSMVVVEGEGGGRRDEEVEEMKRESAKVREEVEKEREMLQLVDVLREERVQMKLQDAKYEYEEKNAALERLRTELEIYLGGTRQVEHDLDVKSQQRRQQQQPHNIGSHHERGTAEEEEEEDSADSDLQSIELNMDNLNKCYKWSFEGDVVKNDGDDDALRTEAGADDSRRASSVEDQVFKGRRSLSEKIQWESICLQKKSPSEGNNIEWDNNLNKKIIGTDHHDHHKGRLSKVNSQRIKNIIDDQFEAIAASS